MKGTMSEKDSPILCFGYQSCKVLAPKMWWNGETEGIVIFTNEKILKLIEYKDEEDIPDEDFKTYLKEIWLDHNSIEQFIVFCSKTSDKTNEQKKLKRIAIETFSKFLGYKSEIFEPKSIDNSLLEANKAIASDFIENIKLFSHFIDKMEALNTCHKNTEYTEIKKMYEDAMVMPALELIKDIQSYKDIVEILSILFEWLEKSFWEAEIILTNTIIIVIKNIKDNKKQLVDLMYCFELVSQNKTQQLLESAMIKPSIEIIKETEKISFNDAIDILKWGIDNSEWEASNLFMEEMSYRQHLNSVNYILQI